MKRALYRELDSFDDESRTYGRVPNRMTKSHSHSRIPTDVMFWVEETEDVYPLNSMGISQFLRKSNFSNAQENVDWMMTKLLNTPITEPIFVEDYTLSITCKCTSDPHDRTLSELGITKSMITRPISQMPVSNRVERGTTMMPVGHGGVRKDMHGIPIGDGKGVLFGIEVPTLYKMLKSTPQYAQTDDTSDVGGFLSETNIEGFRKPKLTKMNRGWQE